MIANSKNSDQTVWLSWLMSVMFWMQSKETHYEKTGFLRMYKQRRRSAVQ